MTPSTTIACIDQARVVAKLGCFSTSMYWCNKPSAMHAYALCASIEHLVLELVFYHRSLTWLHLEELAAWGLVGWVLRVLALHGGQQVEDLKTCFDIICGTIMHFIHAKSCCVTSINDEKDYSSIIDR
jgi:hypothetical protein